MPCAGAQDPEATADSVAEVDAFTRDFEIYLDAALKSNDPEHRSAIPSVATHQMRDQVGSPAPGSPNQRCKKYRRSNEDPVRQPAAPADYPPPGPFTHSRGGHPSRCWNKRAGPLLIGFVRPECIELFGTTESRIPWGYHNECSRMGFARSAALPSSRAAIYEGEIIGSDNNKSSITASLSKSYLFGYRARVHDDEVAERVSFLFIP